MRLFEFEETQVDPDELVDFIQKNCGPYMRANPDITNKLYRGIPRKFIIPQVLSVPQNREPRDTPKPIHDALVDAYRSAGIKASRENSVFATGSYRQAEEYSDNGDVYVIFPIGEIEFSYSEDIKDLYTNINDLFKHGYLQLDLDTSGKGVGMEVYRAMDRVGAISTLQFMDNEKRSRLKEDTMSIKQGIAEYPNGSVERFYKGITVTDIKHFISLGSKITNVNLVDYIKQHVSTTNLEMAIEENVEIQIHCQNYLVVPKGPFGPLQTAWINRNKGNDQ